MGTWTIGMKYVYIVVVYIFILPSFSSQALKQGLGGARRQDFWYYESKALCEPNRRKKKEKFPKLINSNNLLAFSVLSIICPPIFKAAKKEIKIFLLKVESGWRWRNWL